MGQRAAEWRAGTAISREISAADGRIPRDDIIVPVTYLTLDLILLEVSRIECRA
jgi:hypothetical protein